MRYIGGELLDRMNLLGVDSSDLADMTFMDEDTIKSKNVKAKIQDYMNDYAFVNDILLEVY